MAVAVHIASVLVGFITIEQIVIDDSDIDSVDVAVAIHITHGHSPLLIEPPCGR